MYLNEIHSLQSNFMRAKIILNRQNELLGIEIMWLTAT